MRISIMTMGTRGDVQPYLALALALKERGHGVTLGAPDNFQSWVEGYGIAFKPLGLDIQAFLQDPDVKKVIGGNILQLSKLWRSHVRPMMENTLAAVTELGRGADVIVYHPKIQSVPDVVEAYGAKPVLAAVVPMIPTRAFPPLVFTADFGGEINLWLYRLFSLSRLPYRDILDTWRKDTLGLGPGPKALRIGAIDETDTPVTSLCGVSPSVLPRPDDWPPQAHMTGYWFLDDDTGWTPDPDLARFLGAGAPPVYIGFGSMPMPDPQAFSEKIIEAVVRADVRAVLSKGWGGLTGSGLPKTIHLIDGAPHDTLFPLMSAVVHHGGAGTTAAGLRAGKPTLICPFAVDQPFWGKRVHALHAGPEPIPARRLTAERLAAALTDLTSEPLYAARARTLAGAIAREDGIARAVEVIEAAP